MTSLADLPDTLRSQFICGRNSLDIAQDWLVLNAPKMVNLTRLPWINAMIGIDMGLWSDRGISVHLTFATRTQAMEFGNELGREMEEGSSYFDIEYERFVVHLHYTSSI